MVNQVQDKALAYRIAIIDDTAENSNVLFDKLNLSQFTIGGSCHSFDDEVDFNLDARASAFRQGSICVSLDHFIETSEIKDSNANLHVKIDVDGIEHKVITSAMNSIRNKRTKSVLIELNTNLKLHNKIIGLMEALNYKTTIHPEAIRKEGPFKGIDNHIFIRDF